MIPKFAALTVHEEVVDIVVEVLQFERSEVLLDPILRTFLRSYLAWNSCFLISA